MQVCHGKLAPLKRIKADNCIIYYSPTSHLGGTEKMQAFTAIGIVLPGEPYQVDMGNGFYPFRSNEERLLALLVLVTRYQKGDADLKQTIFQFYLTHINQVNN